MSVTEINHNAKDKTFEISCKVFADDLEEVLKKNYKQSADLSNGKYQAQNDKLIADYFLKHLVLSADGKSAPLKYVGFEKISESVFCYFEASNIPAFKKLDLKNSILQDLNEDQINIIHVIVNGDRKSYKLNYPNTHASFTF